MRASMSVKNSIYALINERWFIVGFWYSVLGTIGTLHGIIYGTYHLDMFLSVWHLTSTQVASVHLVYMIWNVANDLIAGYISDWYKHKYKSNRLALIQPFNILWTFVTLLPFYSMSSIPATYHYFMTISLYDGFFSFVCIVNGALWTDSLTCNQEQRVKLQLIRKPMNAIIVSITLFISYYFWDKSNLFKFRVFLWIVIIISIIATIISCHKLKYYLNEIETEKQNNNNIANNQKEPLIDSKQSKTKLNNDNQSKTDEQKLSLFSFKLFIEQVKSQRNLWMFIGASVMNETQSVFLSQFKSILIDVLLSSWTANERGTYLSFLSFLSTWIGILSLFAIQRKYIGLYQLSKYAILCKILIAFVAMFITGLSPLISALFLFLNIICGNIFVSFFMINVANLCDEQKAYRIANNMPKLSSMVSMYWALHALCAKPLNSLGPVLGTYVLESYGYNKNIDDRPLNEYSNSQKSDIQYGCFQLALCFCGGLSIIQYLFWKRYALHGHKLNQTQKTLTNNDDIL